MQRIELSPPSDPRAIRSVDFGPADRVLLVGRHSADGQMRLAAMDVDSQKWETSYDWALEGAATCARYCDSHRRIVFVDERENAFLIGAGGGDAKVRPLGERIQRVSTTASSKLVGFSGDRSRIVDLAGNEVWSTDRLVDGKAVPKGTLAAIDGSGGSAALMAPNDVELMLVDVPASRVRQRIATALSGGEAIALNDRWVAVIGRGMHGCGVWSRMTGTAAGDRFCKAGQNNNTCQALHPSRPLVAYGTIAGYVVIVDLEANDILYMEKLHRTRLWDMAFSAAGEHLATAGDDGTINVIPLAEVETLGTSRVPV